MNITSTSDEIEKKQIPFNIYQYDAELALAFQSDCEEFLSRFSDLKSTNYGTFSELWKKSLFVSVFEYHEFLLMLQTFIENCFFIAKKFIFSTDIYVQTGAFYLLFALYYKQPVREWIKIRLTKSEADKLNELVEFHKLNKSWEFVYIYSKMRLDGAFYYCALVQPLGLDAKFLKRYDLTSETIHKKNTCTECPIKKFQSMVEKDSLLMELAETDKEYQNLTLKYKEKCKQLYVFPSTVSNDLKKAYNNIFNVTAASELASEEQDRIQEIKSRAMRNLNAIYRAEKPAITRADYIASKNPSANN